MPFSFFPKTEPFFDFLNEAADNATEGAKTFLELCRNWSPESDLIAKLREQESEGDRMTHEIMDRLNRTFITPIDREDIHELAKRIDDVIDVVQVAAERMRIYQIVGTNDLLIKMAEVLLKSAEAVSKAMRSLPDLARSRRTLDYCIEVNRLENEADSLLRTALVDLFKTQQNVIELIKWKEIFEAVETATDKCEDIANIIEGIVVKNA